MPIHHSQMSSTATRRCRTVAPCQPRSQREAARRRGQPLRRGRALRPRRRRAAAPQSSPGGACPMCGLGEACGGQSMSMWRMSAPPEPCVTRIPRPYRLGSSAGRAPTTMPEANSQGSPNPQGASPSTSTSRCSNRGLSPHAAHGFADPSRLTWWDGSSCHESRLRTPFGTE